MFKNLIIGLIAIFVGATGLAVYQAGHVPAQTLGGTLTNLGPTFSSSTIATSSVGIYTSATVLAAKTRGYAFIQNGGSTNVYVCLATTCTAQTGILLTASSSYNISPLNNYIGAVSAISLVATTTLYTTELRF